MCYNAHELCIIAHINIVIKFYGRRKMAKVSIIIPTYNVEMYLVECMDSVVNQTLKDIEIICINDGSTDSSLMRRKTTVSLLLTRKMAVME